MAAWVPYVSVVISMVALAISIGTYRRQGRVAPPVRWEIESGVEKHRRTLRAVNVGHSEATAVVVQLGRRDPSGMFQEHPKEAVAKQWRGTTARIHSGSHLTVGYVQSLERGTPTMVRITWQEGWRKNRVWESRI